MLLDPVAPSGAYGRYLEQAGLDVRPPEVIESIDDGQRISGAGMTFTALHTPGHTRGSVCFRLDVEGERPILFSGDHLFKGSIGRFDLPGGSYDELMASMADKILPLDDAIAVLPGHGEVTSIGDERRFNPFLVELQRELGETAR
jgi:glyoxylase-like metal-dependent hydrolase (beta-lactamase superfamily II)